MRSTKAFTFEEARTIGTELGIEWSKAPFSVGQYLLGLEVELEHGACPGGTHDEELETGRVVLEHLSATSDYYLHLAEIEDESAS